MPLFSFYRERNEKCGAFVQFAFGPGAPAVARDDAPHIGEADPGAFKFRGPMQSLENAKEFLRVTRVETDAVILDKNDDFVFRSGAADFDLGDWPGARVFQRVADQIADHLAEQGGVALDLRQFADLPLDSPVFQVQLHFLQDALDEVIEIDFDFAQFDARGSGEAEQVIDELAHLPG